MRRNENDSDLIRPNAADLVESLRDFGYTLPSALADLVDNSVTAQASSITIELEVGAQPFIAVVDDGRGMSEAELVEAMRMGTRGPLASRPPDDLGRFGLGLKTASLSQGRRVTVVSKQKEKVPAVRRWDLDYLKQKNDWQLLRTGTISSASFEAGLKGAASGTAVIIEDLDRATFLNVPEADLAEHLARALEGIARHLGMIFHRFIEEGLQIRVGSTVLKPWDPFLQHQSTVLPAERLALDGKPIDVQPFILPHHSKLSDEEHDRAAGPNGWNAHQGFYLYRAKRLIVAGSWLNLGLKKEEHYKLARIQVDLPNDLDANWHLNVTKSHISAPAPLRDDLARIARNVRSQASEVYRYRGERQAPNKAQPQRYVWKRTESANEIRYRIDRTHPVVKALLQLNCGHSDLIEDVLKLAERNLPIATLLQEPVKSVDGINAIETEASLLEFASMVKHAEVVFITAGRTPKEARSLVLSAEPFVRFQDQIRQLLDDSR